MVFFIPTIYLAVKRGSYTKGLVYLAIHCVVKYEVLQYSDFLSSILVFRVTLVAMAEISTWFVSLCHMFGVLIIAFGVESNKTSLTSILVPLGMGIMIPLLAGLMLASVGLLLFSLVETETNYQYVHSAWHMIIAISLNRLVLPLSAPSAITANYLLDYKDPPSSPIFTITSGQENLVIASN